MKNILQKLYLFSKLSFSISLLFILILIGYLFYRSYSSLSISENNEAINKSNLQNSINLNSSKIEKIEILLSENNQKLNNIFDILNKKNENINSDNILKEIQNDFMNIKSQLKKIQFDLENNKAVKEQLPKSNIDEINIINIAELIKLKFENGNDFSNELELFSKILGNEGAQITEKLYLINKNFLGSELLLSNFKKETNNYISSNLIKKNKLIETILPYIEIQPSKSKELSDSRLIIIQNILTQLENKKYLEALNSIKSIDKNNDYFISTTQQLSIAIEFKNMLKDFISYG